MTAPFFKADPRLWPMIAASIAKPWPVEAVEMDLLWWADQEEFRGAVLPGRPELVARWGWSEWAVRSRLRALQPSSSEPPANLQRASSKPPARVSLNRGFSHEASSEPPASLQQTSSEPPVDLHTRGTKTDPQSTEHRAQSTERALLSAQAHGVPNDHDSHHRPTSGPTPAGGGNHASASDQLPTGRLPDVGLARSPAGSRDAVDPSPARRTREAAPQSHPGEPPHSPEVTDAPRPTPAPSPDGRHTSSSPAGPAGSATRSAPESHDQPRRGRGVGHRPADPASDPGGVTDDPHVIEARRLALEKLASLGITQKQPVQPAQEVTDGGHGDVGSADRRDMPNAAAATGHAASRVDDVPSGCGSSDRAGEPLAGSDPQAALVSASLLPPGGAGVVHDSRGAPDHVAEPAPLLLTPEPGVSDEAASRLHLHDPRPTGGLFARRSDVPGPVGKSDGPPSDLVDGRRTRGKAASTPKAVDHLAPDSHWSRCARAWVTITGRPRAIEPTSGTGDTIRRAVESDAEAAVYRLERVADAAAGRDHEAGPAGLAALETLRIQRAPAVDMILRGLIGRGSKVTEGNATTRALDRQRVEGPEAFQIAQNGPSRASVGRGVSTHGLSAWERREADRQATTIALHRLARGEVIDAMPDLLQLGGG